MRGPRRWLASLAANRLALVISAQVAGAALALLAVALTTPISSRIALSVAGLGPDVATTAGLTFWLAFGLIGGVRTRLQPGGGVVTFSMPFIVGGTVLGGPLVGGLMGLVSELEVRELRTQPWYGILSNHAVVILAAVAAGSVSSAVEGPLAGLLPGEQAMSFFLTVMVAALVFAVVNVGLVVPTLAVRNDMSLREASRTANAEFRATALAESILAWNLAASYATLGWWAPIAIVALVLAVWQAFDRGEALRHDPMTGVLNELGFTPLLQAAVRRAGSGARCAGLLSLDLDSLWEVNLDHGSAAGDEYLRVSAQRMFRAVRATDAVARKANTGDEFWVLLDDVLDLAAAVRVAERIQAAVRQPIFIRGRDGAEILEAGVSIGVVLIDCGTAMTLRELVTLAEARLQLSKVNHSQIVSDGDGPSADELRAGRNAKARRRRRHP
jgi:diguanylate cyclase (GGDEF)-like protein